MHRLHPSVVLKLDAVANAVGGVVLLVAAGRLAGPLGLGAAWPIRLAGLGLLAYAVENAVVARRPSPAGVRALVAVDLAFSVGVLGLAIADPTSAATWMRWALVVVADLAFVMGLLKAVGARQRARPVAAGLHGRPDGEPTSA